MKKKNGFTLIELLVTIALMLSILGIAIISFINISDKKKEESWRKVKEQVEDAAIEYFVSNEYLFEDLLDKPSGTISVGNLIRQDYLNKVTDPTTGKSVSMCAIVKVTKNGNKYDAEFDETTKNSKKIKCDTINSVTIKEPGAPSIKVELENEAMGDNNWYVDDVMVKATVKTGGNGPIKDVKYCTSFGNCTSFNDLKLTENNEYVVKNAKKTGLDGFNVITSFIATNTFGKTVIGSVTYSKDTKEPTCGNPVGSSTTWTKGSRTINQYCTDETSGCTKNIFTQEFKNTIEKSNITIKDKAGNENKCPVDVYVDNTKPKCGNPDGSSTTWTNQNRTITQKCSDNESGCKSVTNEYKTTKKTDIITIKDAVGNTNTCNVNVYVDKGEPKFAVNLYKEDHTTDTLTSKVYKNNTWYNKYVYTKVSISNKTTSGIKSTVYTTTGATKNDSNKSGESRHINAEGISYITYNVCNNAGTCISSGPYTIKLDHTPPIITYLDGPKAQSCGGKAGVYVKYKVSDELSGIEEVYHYFGEDNGKKSYDEVSKYKIEININNQYEDTVERTWAVGNPKGCDSPNTKGPGTALCYFNNTAVKDKAGNTATGISSSCSKVGKN